MPECQLVAPVFISFCRTVSNSLSDMMERLETLYACCRCSCGNTVRDVNLLEEAGMGSGPADLRMVLLTVASSDSVPNSCQNYQGSKFQGKSFSGGS